MNLDEIDIKIEKDREFIKNRITELRLKADVSEYQMSLELGQSRSYIQGISSGKAMSSMNGFLNICDYFGITPIEFFDTSITEPVLLNEILNHMKRLDENDLQLLFDFVKRLEKT